MRLSLLAPLSLVCLASCCDTTALERARAERALLQRSTPLDLAPEAPPVTACKDVPLLTPDDLAQGTHAGELVAVEGTPTGRSQRMCTQMACTDTCGRALPCCNGCQSQGLVLRAPGMPERVYVTLEGKGFGCRGLDCAMQCYPFGKRPERAYRFVGHYQVSRPSSGGVFVTFAVERYCHV